MHTLPTPSRRLLLTVPALLGAALFLSGCGDANLIERLTSPLGYGICGLIVVILDVLALVELSSSDRTTGSKVLWALLIIFAPVLGCVLYYLFARR
ncbi:MAG: PLD nuclease N-terminal domain-containing protein [Bacteroidota bacterium]